MAKKNESLRLVKTMNVTNCAIYIYIFDRPRLLTTPSGDNDYTGGCTKHKTNGTYMSAVFSDCML